MTRPFRGLRIGYYNDFTAALSAQVDVAEHQKISDSEGGFTGQLDDNDRFGSSVAGLGDPGGDGTADLAVGAPQDDDNWGRLSRFCTFSQSPCTITA